MEPSGTSEKSVKTGRLARGDGPAGIAYRNGFRIYGTPLGMGDARDAGVRFLSSMEERSPRRNERVLLHPAAAAALDRSTSSEVLSLEFHKRIRLGRMELELFPSGLGFGASQLLLTFKGRRILYCGGVRFAVPLFALPAEIPPCDVLLLDAPPAEPKPPAPRRVAAELVASLCEMSTLGLVVVVTGTHSAALDAMGAVALLEFSTHASRGLFEMFRRCLPFFGTSGKIRRLSQRLPKDGILFVPLDRWMRSRFFAMVGKERVVFVGPRKISPSWASLSFRLGEGEDRAGLAAYAGQTHASHVILGQRCDDALAKSLLSNGMDVRQIIRPVQLPFPFM